MENFSYIQESGKNYLRSEMTSKTDYITGMFIHNDIPGFAPSRFKSLNSENYVYYNMKGLIPIKQSLELHKFTAERAENFLRSLIRVCQSMEEFMLPFDRLVTDEAYIYENFSRKNEFCWIYGNSPSDKSFTSLFEKLLDRVEYKDDKAVNIMYSIYQSAKDNENVFNKGTCGYGITGVREKAEEILSAPYKSLDDRAKELIRTENERFKIEAAKFGNTKAVNPVNLKENEDNLDTMAGRYRAEVKNKKLKQAAERADRIRKDKTTPDRENNIKSKLKKIWNYLNADIGSRPSKEEQFVVEEEKPAYKVREVKSTGVEYRETANDPTALLTGAMVGTGVYCLSPEDVNEKNILLTEFPFFIGKSGEKMNLQIEDSTVSRFHARLDKEEDNIWLTDLNSTNGTFLNGIRLIPYDRIKVQRGDSMVISRKRYEFKYLT